MQDRSGSEGPQTSAPVDAPAGSSGEPARLRDDYAHNMERMFAAVSDLYAQHWHDFFHFALFTHEGEGWEKAFRNTHQRYADALRVGQARSVLDLACGRGGFTDFLARHTEGDVLGIDISRSQLSHCRRFERPNLRFAHHDIMAVDRLGETFDAVALLDADCYLPDKRAAIERIAPVMRPGARLLLLSWCKQPGLNRLQEELVLEPFMRYWSVPGLETVPRYRQHFAHAGLHILEASDLSRQVRKNWEFGYEQALHGVQDFSLRRAARLIWKGMKLDADGIRLIKEQFPAALYIKVGFDTGFLRYVYFLVEKPSAPR